MNKKHCDAIIGYVLTVHSRLSFPYVNLLVRLEVYFSGSLVKVLDCILAPLLRITVCTSTSQQEQKNWPNCCSFFLRFALIFRWFRLRKVIGKLYRLQNLASLFRLLSPIKLCNCESNKKT